MKQEPEPEKEQRFYVPLSTQQLYKFKSYFYNP